MLKLSVIGEQKFSGCEIPVIEAGFGKKERIILAKSIADIHNVEVSYINKLINKNIDKFIMDTDVKNIVDDVYNDPELRKKLGLKPSNVNKNTKYVYILSEQGYMKLVASMSNSNDVKWETMNKFIDKYFRMRSDLVEIAGKFLEPNEVNDILKLVNQNPYVKEYTKVLVSPRGKKGSQFKEDKIKPFLDEINKEAAQHLVKSLGVEDLEHIPNVAHKYSTMLIRDFYIPSDNLKREYMGLFEQLVDIRQEVIKDNQKKDNILIENFKSELIKIRSAVKGLLK